MRARTSERIGANQSFKRFAVPSVMCFQSSSTCSFPFKQPETISGLSNLHLHT